MPQAWLIVTSAENFESTKAMGFTVQGVKAKHGKKAQTLQPGDKLVYYVTGRQVFAAIATVTSTCFEDTTPLWRCLSKPSTETYPWRVNIQADVVLPLDHAVPVVPIYQHLTYLTKWPDAHWRLGFQGNLHAWPWADYETVSQAMSQLGAGV